VLVGVGVGGVEDRLIEEGVGHRAVVGFRLVVFEKSLAISLANICVKVEKKLARRFKRTKRGFVGLRPAGGCPGLRMRDWVPIEVSDWGNTGYWSCPRLAGRLRRLRDHGGRWF
jgi:hypothetical protein